MTTPATRGARVAPSPTVPWTWPFVLAVALFVASGAVAMFEYVRFVGAADRVEHTHSVIDRVDSVVSRLVDAETGQRGYLLTNRDDFLASYRGVDGDSRELLARLRALVTDNPSQAAAVDRLASLVEDRCTEMAAVLALHDGGDDRAAIARLADGRGKRIMDDLRATASDMRQTELALLDDRAEQAQASRRAAFGFAVLSLASALALAVVAVSVHRQLEWRQALYARELAARLAAQDTLHESELFNRSLLDHSGDCIQALDADGRILTTNRAGLALLEVDDAERLAGTPWVALWQSDADEASRSLAQAVRSGEGRFRAHRTAASGITRWWDVIVTPAFDSEGRPDRLVSIARDVTGQHQREEERSRLLAREREARADAERAARMKDDFVSTLSHELRTPLNAILGWVAVLRQDRSADTLVTGLDVIARNSQRQSRMIDDLLDVSRIVSGKLRLDVQRVDVASAVEEALVSARPAADARGVALVPILASGGFVDGDPGRVQQIVWNLISNAIKFTPKGGRVQVTLNAVGSHVSITVKDTGQGISPELLPHVFERFRQADASLTRQQGGLGLGLAIVKHLTEMHGGQVQAESEGLGRGSTFTVRLPVSAVRAAGERPAGALWPPLAPPNLLSGVNALIVDDEPDSRDLVQRLLEAAGARVTSAGRAQDAIEWLRGGLAPDVIVSDIGMPEQDGYQFMQEVRGMRDRTSLTPAAALTALARPEDRQRAMMAGYHTHLAKPVDPGELIATVASLTGRTGRPIR